MFVCCGDVACTESCLFRRQLSELEAEKSLVAGLRCEVTELHHSHAAQLDQYSERNRALARFRICTSCSRYLKK